MDPAISEPCYKGTILQRNYRKMTMSFSYNSFVKFHGKFFLSHNMTMLYPKPCYIEVWYKGTELYIIHVLIIQGCVQICCFTRKELLTCILILVFSLLGSYTPLYEETFLYCLWITKP